MLARSPQTTGDPLEAGSALGEPGLTTAEDSGQPYRPTFVSVACAAPFVGQSGQA